MGESPEPALVEAMNRLWVKFLPQLEERVATLEAAAAALCLRLPLGGRPARGKCKCA